METTAIYLDEVFQDQFQILIFTPHLESQELIKQLRIFQTEKEEMLKRNVKIHIIVNNRQSKDAFLKYQVPFNSFSLLVKVKDQVLDQRLDKAVKLTDLFNLTEQKALAN